MRGYSGGGAIAAGLGGAGEARATGSITAAMPIAYRMLEELLCDMDDEAGEKYLGGPDFSSQ